MTHVASMFRRRIDAFLISGQPLREQLPLIAPNTEPFHQLRSKIWTHAISYICRARVLCAAVEVLVACGAHVCVSESKKSRLTQYCDACRFHCCVSHYGLRRSLKTGCSRHFHAMTASKQCAPPARGLTRPTSILVAARFELRTGHALSTFSSPIGIRVLKCFGNPYI